MRRLSRRSPQGEGGPLHIRMWHRPCENNEHGREALREYLEKRTRSASPLRWADRGCPFETRRTQRGRLCTYCRVSTMTFGSFDRVRDDEPGDRLRSRLRLPKRELRLGKPCEGCRAVARRAKADPLHIRMWDRPCENNEHGREVLRVCLEKRTRSASPFRARHPASQRLLIARVCPISSLFAPGDSRRARNIRRRISCSAH